MTTMASHTCLRILTVRALTDISALYITGRRSGSPHTIRAMRAIVAIDEPDTRETAKAGDAYHDVLGASFCIDIPAAAGLRLV